MKPMQFKIILILSLLVLITYGCVKPISKSTSDKVKTIDSYQINWLLGSWQNVTPRGVIVENWMQKDVYSYKGQSVFIQNGDTSVMENIVLKAETNGLYYIPTVSNQNDSQPVKFKLTTSELNNFIFENPLHDFPQTISYRLVNQDSIVAEISGLSKGNLRKQQFPMARIR